MAPSVSVPSGWWPRHIDEVQEILATSMSIAEARARIHQATGFAITTSSLRKAIGDATGQPPSSLLATKLRPGLARTEPAPAAPLADDDPPTQRSVRAAAAIETQTAPDGATPRFEPMPWHDVRPPSPAAPPSFTGVVARVIVPDSHGVYQDDAAVRAFLADLAHIRPAQIVMLGDHVDASGIFSAHQANYLEELDYSYEADCDATTKLLDAIQTAAPNAWMAYLEGNHEAHIARHVVRMKAHARDARAMAALLAPDARLRLRERGITFIAQEAFWGGLAVRGTLKLGRCYFAHGYRVNKHATASHLSDFGACIVHGHTHRMASLHGRTVASDAIGAWCPGTLAKLQPLYRHTAPTDWAHGYGLQFVEPDGRFLHVNVPIVAGRSLLAAMFDYWRPQRLMGTG